MFLVLYNAFCALVFEKSIKALRRRTLANLILQDGSFGRVRSAEYKAKTDFKFCRADILWVRQGPALTLLLRVLVHFVPNVIYSLMVTEASSLCHWSIFFSLSLVDYIRIYPPISNSRFSRFLHRKETSVF